MFGRRARRVLRGGVLLLALTLTAGCGGDGDGDGDEWPPAKPGGHSSRGDTSDARSSEPFYTDKPATLSNSWAVKRDCPTSVYLEFTHSGPRVTDSPVKDHPQDDGGASPSIRWIPPCSAGSNPQLYFDGPVAKVSGSQTSSSCLASTRSAQGDGTALDGYSGRNLAAGDQFCGDFGQIVHFRVTDVSGSPASEITWSVTAWPAPQETEKKEPSDNAVYTDMPLTVSEEVAAAKDCAIGFASVFSDSPIVKYVNGSMAEADIVYFPDCLGIPKIRFGELTAPVEGDVGASACVDAAAGAAENTGEVELSELKVGQRYCEYSSEMDAVALLEVTEVTATAPASVTFSVKHWEVPDSQ